MTPATLLPVKTEVNGRTRYQFPKKEQVEAAEPEYMAYIEQANEELAKHGMPAGSRWNMIIVLSQVKARFPEQLKNSIPHLTIKTFNAWKAEGRKVKKGEKAMQCLTYVSYESEDGEEDDRVIFPKTAHVFGIWQTEPIE
jgi:hypothetical protein